MEMDVTGFDRVLIDTCSVMNDNFRMFVRKYKHLFTASRKKIIVLRPVYLELEKHKRSQDRERSVKAGRGLDIIKHNMDMFVVDDRPGSDREMKMAFADNAFLSDINANITKLSQMVITNDNGLCVDLNKLNHLESCHGKRVLTAFIGGNGQLIKREFNDEADGSQTVEQQDTAPEKGDGGKTLLTILATAGVAALGNLAYTLISKRKDRKSDQTADIGSAEKRGQENEADNDGESAHDDLY